MESTDETEGELRDYMSTTTVALLLSDYKKIEGLSLSSSTSMSEVSKSTHNRLREVRKRLESIYSTLRYYNSKDSKVNECSYQKNLSVLSDEHHIDFSHQSKDKFNNPENLQNDSTHNSSVHFLSNLSSQDFITAYKMYNKIMGFPDVPIGFSREDNEEDCLNFKDTVKITQDEVKEEKNTELDFETKLYTHNEEEICKDSTTTTIYENSENSNPHLLSTNSVINPSKTYLKSILKKTDLNQKSKINLLQEVLQFEKELLSKIVTENKQLEDLHKIETFDESNIQKKGESFYQAKKLDMIKEESSGNISDKSKDQLFIISKNSECQTHIISDNTTIDKDFAIVQTSNDEVLSEERSSSLQISECDEVNQNDDSMPVLENLNDDNATKNTFTIDSNENSKNEEVENKICENKITYSEQLLDPNVMDSKLKSLSDSLSDSSVNKLIDRLIETEQKSKSLKIISDKKLLEEYLLKNECDPQNFPELVSLENEESKNCLVETEENQAEQKYNEKNCCIDKKISDVSESTNDDEKSFTLANKNDNSCSLPQCIAKKDEKEDKCYEITLDNFQDNNFTIIKTSSSHSNCKIETPESQMEISGIVDDKKLTLDSNLLFKKKIQNSNETETENTEHKKDENNETCNNEKCNQKNKNPRNISIHLDYGHDCGKIIITKEAGDLCDCNEVFSPQSKTNQCNEISKSNEAISISLSFGDSNTSKLESTNCYKNPEKSKNSADYICDRTPSNLSMKNSDQNVTGIFRYATTNSIQKPFAKGNFNYDHRRHLKLKSNFRLASTGKTKLVGSHRRSKSFVMTGDAALNINNTVLKMNSATEISKFSDNFKPKHENPSNSSLPLTLISSSSSKKLSLDSSLPLKRSMDHINMIQMQRCSPETYLNKITSKSCTILSDTVSTGNEKGRHEISASNSSLQKKAYGFFKSQSEIFRKNDGSDSDGDESKRSSETSLRTPRSSKSGIPIIKKKGLQKNELVQLKGSKTVNELKFENFLKNDENKLDKDKLEEKKDVGSVNSDEALKLHRSKNSDCNKCISQSLTNLTTENEKRKKLSEKNKSLKISKKNKTLETQNFANEKKSDERKVNNNQLTFSPQLQNAALATSMISSNSDITSREREISEKSFTKDLNTPTIDLSDVNTVENKINQYKVFEVTEESTRDE